MAVAPWSASGQPPSRVRRSTRQDFLRVLIIVDARQAQGLHFRRCPIMWRWCRWPNWIRMGKPRGFPASSTCLRTIGTVGRRRRP